MSYREHMGAMLPLVEPHRIEGIPMRVQKYLTILNKDLKLGPCIGHF